MRLKIGLSYSFFSYLACYLQDECPLGKLLNPSIIICEWISVVQISTVDNPKTGSTVSKGGWQRDSISGLGLPAVT